MRWQRVGRTDTAPSLPMHGLIQEPPYPAERDSNWRPILLGVVLVLVVVGLIALLLRGQPKATTTPHPYAQNVKLSDLKMSAAQNFVGASVTYLDGTVTNRADKTVTHAAVHVTFKNSLGQISQAEDVPLRELQTSGPYPDAVDINASPLAPGQSKPFRLTFEHITQDWNHQYPDLEITDVSVK
jgi:Protein of unknown function (DUF2393)